MLMDSDENNNNNDNNGTRDRGFSVGEQAGEGTAHRSTG